MGDPNCNLLNNSSVDAKALLDTCNNLNLSLESNCPGTNEDYRTNYTATHDITGMRYLWRMYSKWALLFIKTYEHQNKVVRRSLRC